MFAVVAARYKVAMVVMGRVGMNQSYVSLSKFDVRSLME
jgi:hypothetical protein